MSEDRNETEGKKSHGINSGRWFVITTIFQTIVFFVVIAQCYHAEHPEAKQARFYQAIWVLIAQIWCVHAWKATTALRSVGNAIEGLYHDIGKKIKSEETLDDTNTDD